MADLLLIPTAQTDWRVQGRLSGDTDLPLNEFGHLQAVSDGQALADQNPTAVHSGPEQATKQTAAVIAHELGLKAKTSKDLREMDLGHWEGLAVDDFRERFSKTYRQWRLEPMSIEPPEGEAVAEVAARLKTRIRRIVERHGNGAIILVLGQFATAIVRCELDDQSYERFWEYVDGDERFHSITLTNTGDPIGHSRT